MNGQSLYRILAPPINCCHSPILLERLWTTKHFTCECTNVPLCGLFISFVHDACQQKWSAGPSKRSLSAVMTAFGTTTIPTIQLLYTATYELVIVMYFLRHVYYVDPPSQPLTVSCLAVVQIDCYKFSEVECGHVNRQGTNEILGNDESRQFIVCKSKRVQYVIHASNCREGSCCYCIRWEHGSWQQHHFRLSCTSIYHVSRT